MTNLKKKQRVGANATVSAGANNKALQLAPANAATNAGAFAGTNETFFKSFSDNYHKILSYFVSQYEIGNPFQVNCLELFQITGVNPDTAQRILGKFSGRGLLRKEKFRDGRHQGLTITLLKPCEAYLRFRQRGGGVPASLPANAPASVAALNEVSSSSYKLNLTSAARQILTITDDDIALSYPGIAAIHFGADQLRQIVEQRAKLDKNLDGIIMSLDHANFALEQGIFVDNRGKRVAKPRGYLFKVLLESGYYEKPDGYLTREEQAVQAIEKRKAEIEEAQRIAEDEAFYTWEGAVTAEEKEKILQQIPAGPEEQRMRFYWCKHVKIKTSRHEEE